MGGGYGSTQAVPRGSMALTGACLTVGFDWLTATSTGWSQPASTPTSSIRFLPPPGAA
jgi:hypothetical protein